MSGKRRALGRENRGGGDSPVRRGRAIRWVPEYARPVHDAPRHTRVVIVTAEVGEGHAAAARALAAGLAAESPDAEVVICDALEGLGRFVRLILLDAYRWQ